MKRLNKTNTILIASLISLVLSAGAYACIYFSFSAMKGEVGDLYAESAKSKATHDELAKVKENLKTTLGTGDRLSSLFIGRDSVVDFIQMIEDVMRTAGVSGTVDGVTESKTAELDAIGKNELHLTVSASGSFNSIMKFEGLLEKIPYKATINSATFSYKDGGETGASGWRATVMITAISEAPAAKSSAPETSNQNTDEEI